MMRALGGDQWTDSVLRNFSHTVDPVTGRVSLTTAGVDQFETLLRRYLTGKVSSPTLTDKLNKFFAIAQGLYLRARGINESPTLGALQLDAMLRPDLLVRPALLDIVGQAIYAPRTLVVSADPATRIGENIRRAQGQRAEAVRTKTSRVEASLALGIKKGDTEIALTDAIANAVAQVATEQARRQTSVLRSMKLVRVTTRSIVPEERVPVIRQRVREKLGLAGIDPKEVAKQVNDKTGVISFTTAQKPLIYTLVQQVKGTWFGDMLPYELSSASFDGSEMSLVAYNRLVEMITDTVAGPGSMRDRRAEAVPKSVGYALQSVLVNTVTSEGYFADVKSKLLQNFHVEFDGANHVDPGIVDVVEKLKRELAGINVWLRETAKRAAESTKGNFPDIVKALASRLVPPLQTHALFDVVDPVTKQITKYGLVGLDKLLKGGGALSLIDLLGRITDIEDVFAAFKPNGRDVTSDLEFMALADLRVIEGEIAAGLYPADALPDPVKTRVSDAQDILAEGISRRAAVVSERAKEIALALAGGQDSGIMQNFTDLERHAVFYARFYDGDWPGLFDLGASVGLTVALEQFGEFNKKYSQSEALLAMVGRLRAQELIGELSERLTMYGVQGDANALTKSIVIGGMTGRTQFMDTVQFYMNTILQFGEMEQRAKGRPGGLVYEPPAPTNGHDLAAYSTAVELLQQWGFKYGKGEFVQHVLPDGTRMLMPKMVADNLNDALNRQSSLQGAFRQVEASRGPGMENVLDVPMTERQKKAKEKAEADEKKRMVVGAVAGATLGSFIAAPVAGAVVGAVAAKELRSTIDMLIEKSPVSMALLKRGVTTGLGIPNIPYYFANAFGGFMQSMMGAGGTQTVRMLVSNPRFVSAVVSELFGFEYVRFTAKPIVTADGRIFTVREAAKVSEAEGLSGSFIQAETVQTIAEDIREMEPTFYNKVAAPFRGWQNLLTEFASSIDNTYRVAAFVDEVRLGKSTAEAAETARRIAFDYTALTDFEKENMRNTIMFYSYMRRTVDLFWDTLLTNPGRITAQFRTLNYANEQLLGEDNDILGPAYLEGRMALFVRQSIVDSYASGKVAVFAPAIPAMDPVNLVSDAVSVVSSEDARRELVARLTPWAQAPFVLALGVEPFSGRELGTYDKVPMYVYETDMMLTGGVLTRGGFGVRWQSNRDPSSNDTDESTGYMQATNPRAYWIWRNLLQFPGAGRSMAELEKLDRLDSGAIETVVGAAKAYRRAGGVEEVDKFFGVVAEALPETLTEEQTMPVMRDPNLYPIRDEDTASLRPGFSGLNETLAFIGLPSRRLDNEAIALDRAYREAGFDISATRKDLRRAAQFPKQP